MRIRRFTALAAVLALGLTACGNEDQPESAAPTAATAVTEEAPASQSPTPTAAPTVAPTPATPAPTPAAAAPTPAAAAKTYRMNANYDIVPVDPAGNKKVVLLTFDDGPKELDMLKPMLDTLDKHKAKAIFFVNGYRIKQKPELLQLIHERGQTIGNHSWDHIDLKKETPVSIDKQLTDVQNIVKELTGSAPVFFRPPHGSSNDYVKQKAKSEGMLFMTWSNGSLDWDASTKNKPEAVIKNVMDQLHNGSNILMHELPWTVAALDELLTKLSEAGYSFVDPAAIETP